MRNFRLLTYLLITGLVISCASYSIIEVHSNNLDFSSRGPSSSDSEENLKSSFDTIMDSENPEKEFLAYLERLKNMFARAEVTLSEFDQELDGAPTDNGPIAIENFKSYKKMIILWSLSHRLQDKISYHYLALTNTANDKNNSILKRQVAKNILKSFTSKLNSKNALEKISFEEIKENLSDLLKDKIEEKGNQDVIPQKAFLNEEEKIQLLRNNRGQFKAMGKVEQYVNAELTKQIEDDADQLQLLDQKGRIPQQIDSKIFPSAGVNGNIQGRSFPKGVWALTYDDGPHPTYTPAIIKNLKELGIKATFFWLAENVLRYQNIVNLVKSNGDVMANHSWSHAQLPKLSAPKLRKEIIESTVVETKAYGEKPQYFRCPYGAGNSVPRIRNMIAEQGMIHVYWNVDTLDWQDKDPDSILRRAKKQMQAAGRGVVLFHDIHPQSVIASKKLVDWSQSLKGTDNEIRWVTIPEIVKEINEGGK